MSRRLGFLPASLAATARAQSGCFTLDQAQWSGLPEWRLRTLVSVGILESVHRCVVRVAGSPRTPHQRAWAAYLSVGDPAAACAETGAWVLGWSGYELPDRPQLAVPNDRRPRTALAEVRHLSRWYDVVRDGSDECFVRDTIPVLAPEDVVLTIARDASPAGVLHAVQAGSFAGRLDLIALLARTGRGVPGSPRVREAVARFARGHDSEPEVRTYGALLEAGLAPDHTNVVLVGREGRVGPFDGYYECGLAYEYDGAKSHRGPRRRRTDGRKQDLAARQDVDVLRLDRSWLAQPAALVAAVRDAVAQRSARPRPPVTVQHLEGRSCVCGHLASTPTVPILWTGS